MSDAQLALVRVLREFIGEERRTIREVQGE